jgi:DNA-binding NtrC family response regulator
MKYFPSIDVTILLLDSDSLTRVVFVETLQSAGYLVIPASDIGAAVDRLNEVRPDLLIIRPNINSMPGHIAADYLRSKCPGLPVLILAGFVDDERIDVQNTIREFYTFPQPFTRDDVLAKVRDVLKSELDKHKR